MILKNIFAPKVQKLAKGDDWRLSHCISYDRCNFHCGFCSMRNRDKSLFHEYNEQEFALVVQVLLRDGNRFKFTGGEQTLNPNLMRDLAIVKAAGGMVFLDTNGSRPNVLRQALDENLVDVLALSLKGLNESEAMSTAEITNTQLCFTNVFQSLSIANEHPEVITLFTYVIDASKNAEECLEKFYSLASSYENIRLKINNIHPNQETQRHHFEPCDVNDLQNAICNFLLHHKNYKNGITYIPTRDAISDYDSTVFL